MASTANHKAVDLNDLMGMLGVSSSGDARERRDGGTGVGSHRDESVDKRDGAGWSSRSTTTTNNNSKPAQRKGGQERSELYRSKGNDLFRLGAYEDAVDYYTRAINADPRNEKALGNRCAAYTMMKRFREALNDAEYGLRLNPRWAKLHSRKAVAHFYLKEYDDSVQAYAKALEHDTENVDYRKGLEQAKKRGGSVENLRRKKKEEEERDRREREAKAIERRRMQGGQPSHLHKVEAERKAKERDRDRDRELTERYERECLQYKQARRECLDKWRRSTGLVEEKPEEDRGRSVRVDIFGTLRGRCLKQDCDCKAWHRDVDAVHNAWGNMEAIQCSRCGYSNAEHEDCGQYPMSAPAKPRGMRVEEVKIPGIHKAF